MTEPLQSLWPDDVEADDVLTPLAILKFQADDLKKRTNGRLQVDVESTVDETSVNHFFDIVAPTLNNYRFRLFQVAHNSERVYPATVNASVFRGGRETAPTQSEFAVLIGNVLQSQNTRSVIHSLLARIHEASR